MTEQRAKYLLSLYFRQGCTPPEQEELYQWIHDCPDDEDLRRVMQEVWADFAPTDVMDDDRAKQMLSRILITAHDAPSVKGLIRPMARKWMAAAAVLVIAGSVSFYYLHRRKSTTSLAAPPEIAKINVPKGDVLPGTTNATLTLDDGSSIVLDTVSGTTVASQGSTRIIKQNGQVVYQNRNNASNTASLIYNTLSTSRGHEYPLTLSDGTKVWLNASSSIRFPVQFSDKQRAVSITGEVYFEVAKDKHKPFRVTAGDQEIEVLGTHFNINAYSDEDHIKTSLLEGSIKVNRTLLQPGQAFIHGEISPTDVDQDIAWKNGVFNFDNQTLTQVMRQLARWYDLEVVYPQGIPKKKYGGEMGRNLTLDQVLKGLENSGVHFQLNGKRLIVSS